MRRFRLFVHVAFLSFFFQSCGNQTKTEKVDDPGTALVRRVVGEKASEFEVEYIDQEDGKDVFELESKDDKIVLRGNNGISVASALNYYLKHYCYRDISWNNISVVLDETLPLVEGKIRKASPYKYRYYLNYCTFNYTMAWWDWEQWQQEIDWMALNGINMPLALTGEEAIWRQVYHTLGFTDKELETFFTGPAYFSWFWMGNIDGWGGPLPVHWMESHRELQKKIVEKERSLGMMPVLPAFTGHVPPSFQAKFPNAKLKQTNWGAGFDDVFILDPQDSLFEKIGSLFLETQTKEYGTNHFYSADTFNENVPPTNDSTFLSNISRKVFQSMAKTDPKAVWLMQGWMFHYNDEFWKPTQIKALLAGVPDDQMIILDLYSESHPVWNQTSAYYGKPWIWNMLQNFGGNVSLFGRMEHVAKDPSEALRDSTSGKMMGIGLTPEGNHQNPALFELMMENVWQQDPIPVKEWLKGYARRRYGAENKSIDEAWSILERTVYNGGLTEGGAESILVARPVFEAQGHRVLTKLNYNPDDLVHAWELFISSPTNFRNNKEFRYDLTDITRQVLANYASPLHDRITKAYQQKDIASYNKYTQEFLGLLDDLDTLLKTHPDFMLGKWIQDARRWGQTPQEEDLYEFNARDLVTLWGDKNSELHEYSNRQWSGLIKGFYKPRWEQFFSYTRQCLQEQKKVDMIAFENKIKDWEWEWVNSTTEHYPALPEGDPVAIVEHLYKKYQERLISRPDKY